MTKGEIDKLLGYNREWASSKYQQDPDWFKSLEEQQTPTYLWIGCSDSRVPSNMITGTKLGEMFVHRNIANMVIHTDFNMLSVLEYAVTVLEVEHIIVCGHYGCGGIQNALSRRSLGLINKWLRHIKDVYRIYRAELDAIPDEKQRLERLVELNVIEQVHNVAETTIVQRAWYKRNAPHIHGWVYNMGDGLIKPLTKIAANQTIEPFYMYQFDES